MAASTSTATTNLKVPEPPVRILAITNPDRLVSPFGPGAENLTHGQVEGPTTVYHYYCPDEEVRDVMANQMLESLVSQTGDQTEGAIISKVLSVFSCLFYGERENLNHPMSSVRPGRIPADYHQYLKTFTQPERDETGPTSDTDPTPITRRVPYTPDSLMGVQVTNNEYTKKELFALFSVCVFGIVKEVNEDNQTAFTERRKNAIMRQLRIPADADITKAGRWWTKEALEKIHSAFNVYVTARIQLVSEVCRWSTAPVTDMRGWVWGQVRLVRGHGMVPMEAMASFVNACTHIIQGHTVLYEEALIFLQAKAEFDKLDSFSRNFNKAIMGNLYTPLPVGRMQNLLGASVAYGKIASKTFGNYRGGKMDPTIQAYVTSSLAVMM